MQSKSSDENPRHNTGSVRFPDGSSIVRPVELDWTPWALPGTTFKLLSFNRRSGNWSCIVKFDPGVRLPPQRQFGDAFIYVMQGGCRADDHPIGTGHFRVDAGGTTNDRVIGDNGMTAYMMFLGGFAATDERGRPTTAFIDGEWAYEAADANAAADHIPPAPPLRPS